MLITLEKLKELDTCSDGLNYFEEHQFNEIGHELLIRHLTGAEKYSWANWLVSRLLTSDNCVRYAIYAAELVLHIFENEHPHDARPRKAIEAAKNYLRDKTAENMEAAWAAMDADWAVGDAAGAADWAAAWAVGAATWAAGAAGAAAGNEMLKQIINYGIGLLKEQKKC